MEVLWRCYAASGITTIVGRRGAGSVKGQGWVRDNHSEHHRRTFTWILIGRGIPSFSSLVFSLKSLQNCPMGIPLWMGNKHGKIIYDPFKMYEKSRARKHSDVTLCHTVLPECRSLRCCHSIIHKTSED